MECKNCGHTFEGKFCNNCGQKANIHRLTIKHYLHDALHTFTHLDTGILYLIKELLIRPGEVVKEYIGGARQKYFSPMQFLILGIGISTFLSITFQLMGPTQGGTVPGQSGAMVEFFRQFNVFIYKYYNVMNFVSVPILAFLTFLFFKSSKYNYAENLVLNTFLSGERCLLYISLSPFLYFFKKQFLLVIGAYYILFIIYFIRGYTQFFNPQNKFFGILKSLVLIFLYLVINQMLFMGLFALFFYRPA